MFSSRLRSRAVAFDTRRQGGWMRQRLVVLSVLAVCVVSVALFGSDQAEPPGGSLGLLNASDGRTLGVGVESLVGAYFPVGVTARYWFSPEWGAEGVLCFEHWENGCGTWSASQFSLRNLFRVVDHALADFYIAAGVHLYGNSDGLRDTEVSLWGGMEWSSLYTPEIAWSIDFGVYRSLRGSMTVGLTTAIHYYALWSQPDQAGVDGGSDSDQRALDAGEEGQ